METFGHGVPRGKKPSAESRSVGSDHKTGYTPAGNPQRWRDQGLHVLLDVQWSLLCCLFYVILLWEGSWPRSHLLFSEGEVSLVHQVNGEISKEVAPWTRTSAELGLKAAMRRLLGGPAKGGLGRAERMGRKDRQANKAERPGKVGECTGEEAWEAEARASNWQQGREAGAGTEGE